MILLSLKVTTWYIFNFQSPKYHLLIGVENTGDDHQQFHSHQGHSSRKSSELIPGPRPISKTEEDIKDLHWYINAVISIDFQRTPAFYFRTFNLTNTN